MAEVRISSGGEHLEAKEATNDMYASIDVVLGKLERQIRSQHGAAKAKAKGGESVRKAPAARVPDLEVDAPRLKSAAKVVKKVAKKRVAKAKR
jgi:hypothetical protein